MKNNDKNLLFWILGAVVVLFLLGGFGMFGYRSSGYGYGGMMYGFSGMWIFGGLFMVLILVALVLLIVWLWNQIQNPRSRRK